MKKVIGFLSALKQNNNKSWFDQNRKWYEESRDKMLFLTEVLIDNIRKFDPDIPVMNPRDCVFRIFRDIRFSADKSPYKTYMGTFISRGGRKSERAGYYVHVEPGSGFAGGGIYHPEPEPLKAIRQHIYENSEQLLEIINDPDFSQIFHGIYGEKLKSAPKGFPKDFPHIDLLKFTSYAFSVDIVDGTITGDDYITELQRIFKELSKVNSYLNQALDKYFNKF